MQLIWQILLACVVGYLLGSVSFATLIAKKHGIDIFKEGSCNPGATNVKRVLGKKAGNTVFALDFIKGFVAAVLPLLLAPVENRELLAIISIIAAIVGHSFSIFLRFRGGKGVATTMGGFLALVPWVLLIGLIVWLVVYYSLKYVSLASILFGVSLPVSAYFLNESIWVLGFCGLIAGLLVIRHRQNIGRLMRGAENRFK
jgi:acyl phosphate:glycerol-3-phosphate acyltransferase